MKKGLRFLLVAGLLVAGVTGFFGGNAHALSFGNQIVIERVKDSTFFWSAVVAVGPSVEIQGRVHDIDLDPGVPQIGLSYNLEGAFGDANFNGFRFWDMTNTVDDFEDVSIWSTNMFGFDESRIAFNGDNIYMNFAGLAFDPGSYVNLQLGASIVGFSQEPTAAPVPEPGTIILVGSGLLGLTGLGRRKFKVSK